MGIGPAAAKNIVVVGDDPALEMRMANGAGAVVIGLTTGLMQRDSVATLSAAETPMAQLDSLAPLLNALT